MRNAVLMVFRISIFCRTFAAETFAEQQRGAVGFAVAKDAVVPTINAKNPVYNELKQHGVTRDDLVALWIKGQKKTWGQVAGTSDATPITVYTRSDACGAAETWALYLGGKQDCTITM